MTGKPGSQSSCGRLSTLRVGGLPLWFCARMRLHSEKRCGRFERPMRLCVPFDVCHLKSAHICRSRVFFGPSAALHGELAPIASEADIKDASLAAVRNDLLALG